MTEMNGPSETAQQNSGEGQTYRSMLLEVEEICKNVAVPDLDLDEMVQKVEKGYQLIQAMRQRLDATRERIDHLRVEIEGSNPKHDNR